MRLEAHHKLHSPTALNRREITQIQGQDAYWILPSEDQPADMSGQAALIVRYTQPVRIGGDVFHYFILWADQDHIKEMAETVQFVVMPPPEEAPTSEGHIIGWQVFCDGEYRFQTQYPADWTFRETKIDDSGGDIVIKRVLGFSPQGWKDAIFSS